MYSETRHALIRIVKRMHPLRRLFEYARQYRAQVVIASVYSVLNKLFDVLPEVLIG